MTDLLSLSCESKRVMVRVDFNVPLNNSEIVDDTRIKASIPTLKLLLEKKAKVICVAHLGRPKGKINPELSLAPISKRLSEWLGNDVLFIDKPIGQSVADKINALDPGSICLLENIRFYEAETKNDVNFSKQLAELADIFVQDAFGAVHRAHASTEGVCHYLDSYSGLLVEREVEFLSKAVNSDEKPIVAIIGGAKISTKIGVIENLLDKVDSLIIGGGMAFTFLKANGYSIGKSLCEDDQLDLAKSLIEKAHRIGKKLLLPIDVVVAETFSNDSRGQTVDVQSISEEVMGLDVGPESLELFQQEISNAKLVVWNGPMGVFEFDQYAKGTFEIGKALANSGAVTIVGGGDSISALEKLQLSDKMSHISTGGGACLEFLEGKLLPGLAALGVKND